MDASRSEPEFLAEVLDVAVECGATTINVPDTVGYALPLEFGDFIRELYRLVPVAARRARERALPQRPRPGHGQLAGRGARRRHAGGVRRQRHRRARRQRLARRGRHGHPHARRVLRLRDRRGHHGDRAHQPPGELAHRLRRSSATRRSSGRNAFAHESGIHQAGVLSEASTFEIMTPADVGLADNDIVLGKHSGRHALRAKLAELGYTALGRRARATPSSASRRSPTRRSRSRCSTSRRW